MADSQQSVFIIGACRQPGELHCLARHADISYRDDMQECTDYHCTRSIRKMKRHHTITHYYPIYIREAFVFESPFFRYI